MRILAGGSIGIGTSAPDTAAGLTIKQTTIGAGVRVVGHDNSYAGYFGVGTSGYTTVNALGDRGLILDADSIVLFYTNDTEHGRVDANGNITWPLNPAFYSYLGATADVSTTHRTIEFDSTRYNVGSHFNTTTHTFVAPVAGVYAFQLNIGLNSITESAHYYAFIFQTSNQAADTWMAIQENQKAQDYSSYNFSRSYYMDASDSIFVSLTGSGTGQFTSIRAGAGDCSFSGHLQG
jgi:hypothetical protein